MPELPCYFCGDGIRKYVHIVGSEYGVWYPCEKEGTILFEKYTPVMGGFLQHNCRSFQLLVSDELASLLARPRVAKYRTRPKEVIEIYDRLMNERGFH